jgi:hypothetical protein
MAIAPQPPAAAGGPRRNGRKPDSDADNRTLSGFKATPPTNPRVLVGDANI